MTMTADSPTEAGDAPAHEPNHSVPRTITGRRKIAILGYTWSLVDAPYDDPTWEKWAINDAFALTRPGNIDMPSIVAAGKVDAWYDLHTPKLVADKQAWLQTQHPFPVYLLPGVAEQLGFEVPSARVFPRAEMVEEFGTYFTNTISWLIALAISQLAGVDGAEIGVYGVDMAVGSEFESQRPSCEYFIGLARGLGIPVHIPETSDLLKTAVLYGETHPMEAKLDQRIVELEQRRAHVAQVVQDHQFMHERIEGALEDARHWRLIWFAPRTSTAGREVMNQPSDGIASAMPPV